MWNTESMQREAGDWSQKVTVDGVGDAVGSHETGSEFLGLSVKVGVMVGEPDLVIYVVQSF